MDETTLYFYLFSTIAQTLAAILGLLSVFVVFRYQVLDQRTRDDVDKLKAVGPNINVPAFYLASPTDEALKSIREHVKQWEGLERYKNNQWLEKTKTLLADYDKTSKRIRQTIVDFVIQASLSTFIIGLSVFGIVVNWNIPPTFFPFLSHGVFWGFLMSLVISLGFVLRALRA